jgi:two-component system sensor histidine kinase/response regulator
MKGAGCDRGCLRGMGETILVLDDNSDFLTNIELILEMEGYRVLSACSGSEALTLLDQTKPDLIISDIMMPEMDGYEFYQRVRRNLDLLTVPFIFLSAKGEREEVRFGKRLGVDEYLTKPLEPKDLLIAVRAKLRRLREIKAGSRQEVERLKGVVLRVLSHELRTPLTMVKAAVELLVESKIHLYDEEEQALLSLASKGGERLETLIMDVLTVMNIEAGGAKKLFEIEKQEVDLSCCIEDALAGCGREATSRGVAIRVDVPKGFPVVVGYPEQLTDVLRRLLDNAIKFSPQIGGQVVIRARSEDGGVKVSVEDEGVGIPMAEIPKIFDLFYQVNRDQYEQQGIGIGLTIARELVEIHGGSIEVESEVGKGSTFTVVLPGSPSQGGDLRGM